MFHAVVASCFIHRLPTARAMTRVIAQAMLFSSMALLHGCASVPERTPLPRELTNDAVVPGIPNARFWADEWPKYGLDRFNTLTDAQLKADFEVIYNKPHNYLAISGGGANGAFGAGLLAGWTAAGTRPQFTMVTGVSTGALSAPFAFLGPDYDDQLKLVYTTTSTKDIIEKRSLLEAAFGDSMTDTAPLKALIARYITADVIAAIAREHQRGRRLFIGTANLDAGRGVIWNLGAIAASDHPDKIALVHDVLRASAAIPVAFPPVVFKVEANGKIYDEMHVDGGTASQVFVYPAAVDWRAITEKLRVVGKPQVYVLRNAFLGANASGVKRSILPIATRSIDSLIRTQGVGDLYQIYALCRRDGNDFNLAYIPADFTDEPSEGFDPVYMRKLYDRWFQMARNGYIWDHAPPGFINEN